MSKKINQLDSATDVQAANDGWFFPFADPVNGLALKVSGAQAKAVFRTSKFKYTATGSEGVTLTISTILNQNILLIVRESSVIYETLGIPDSTEFSFDGVDITLGAAVGGAGERFLILYTAQ